MMKALVMVLLVMVLSVMVVGVAAADTAQPGAAQAQASTGEYTNVSGVVPFSASANFMSLAGYLRWTSFKDDGVWLSRVESQRIVTAQTA